MENVVVFVTAKDIKEARKIARKVVEHKLAACCNIVPGVRSIYVWKGKVCDSAEVLLIIKTRKALFAALEREVCRSHSYEVPEIVAFPIVKGSAPYLKWLKENT